MVQSLKMILWGGEIGRLIWYAKRRFSYFIYNPIFLKKGLNIAPLTAPIDGVKGFMLVWGEEVTIYKSFRHLWQIHCLMHVENNFLICGVNRTICQMQILLLFNELSFIGKRGMGALEFLLEVSIERKTEKNRYQIISKFS